MSHALWPAVNATLNATSASLVLAGLACILAKRTTAHLICMAGACVVTAAFFLSYLAYHAQVGSVKFHGTGWERWAYFAILVSHTVLAVVIVPLVVRTLWLATRKRFEEHKRIARWTAPLWLYVSVTGIVVYWMLYHA
jgi:uncharacterized membrane protein YozB (DUF420 family)